MCHEYRTPVSSDQIVIRKSQFSLYRIARYRIGIGIVIGLVSDLACIMNRRRRKDRFRSAICVRVTGLVLGLIEIEGGEGRRG